MLFNTPEFLFLFLPLCLILSYFLFTFKKNKNYNLGIFSLIGFSFIFYGYWSIKYLLLLLVSIIINYFLGQKIYQKNSTKILLIIGIVFNLSLIGYFKYSNFLIDNLNYIFNSGFSYLEIILPLAISFYTFQQIAFLVDCNRKGFEFPKFSEYLLFVSFFPQLIAGPIVHHRQVIPFFKNIKISSESLSYGLSYFSLGLFKKVMIADKMGSYADPLFLAVERAQSVSLLESWVGVLAYTFQIYFDFSGYSDMAIGLGKIFNLDLPLNFNSPYKSKNIVDFWRRWHITLSSFLRDYLYIPLGGNRNGKISRYRNLLLTMLLGGLWHGASWTFIIWGGLHGGYLIVNHAKSYFFPAKNKSSILSNSLSIMLTFFCVISAWVFFRANSFQSAFMVFEGLFGLNGLKIIPKLAFLTNVVPNDLISLGADSNILLGKTQLLHIFLAGTICFFAPNTQEIMSYKMKEDKKRIWKMDFKSAMLISLIILVSIINLNLDNAFIYFQF